jgi:hypothetical protein
MAAFALPFELFLFSYAVLGPLHYLTEITWLHQRRYFTTAKSDFVWLVVLCVFASLFSITFKGYHDLATLSVFVAFVAALSMVIFREWWKKLLLSVAACWMGTFILHTPPFFFVFGVFLPTLIHVFLFTGLFMISGALKSRSTYGFVSAGFFFGSALLFFVYTPVFSWYEVSEYAQKSLVASGFVAVNQAVFKVFQLGNLTRETLFGNPVSIGVMRFIAFAYTYHYLNWFSKTSVIKWHEVPRWWMWVVIVLWLVSVGLYAYDYKTGLVNLYCLSMMHVFLEFPLNFRSMADIGKNMRLLLLSK